MAKYFRALIISNGCEIYDEQCFIANMPPMDLKKFRNAEFLQEQIISHSALNLTLQERLHELESEIIDIHRKCLIIKYEIENDPEYTRNLYQAWKAMKEKKREQARIAAMPKPKLKDEKGNLIKKQDGTSGIPGRDKPKEKVYKEGEPRPITLDEFI
jgi:hypothetical protein